MRILAGCLIALGLLLAGASFPIAERWTEARVNAYYQYETQTAGTALNAHRLSALLDMIHAGRGPAWVAILPWPGVAVGLGMAAVGIIVLAIRRPARDGEEEYTSSFDEAMRRKR